MSAIDKEVNYSVVYLGEVAVGFNKDQVLKNLINITRMSEIDVKKKFFNSQNTRVVIKRTNDLEKARRYHGKFLRAGISVGIQMDFDEA